MAAYLEYVQELRRSFALFEVVHVPREKNARADLLAKLASSGKGGRQRTVIQETLKTPRAFMADHRVLHVCRSTERTARSHRSLTQETLRTPRVRVRTAEEVRTTQVCAIHEPDTWITPYQRYLADGVLLMDSTEARMMKKSSSKFTLIDGELYRFGFTHPLLVCVHGEKCTRIMAELHEGICGSHIGGRSLATRTVRAGYYWPTNEGRLQEIRPALQAMPAVRRLAQGTPRRVKVNLQPLAVPHVGNRHSGALLVSDQENEVFGCGDRILHKMDQGRTNSQITAHKIQSFVWKNIVCRFGVPKRLVSDNGTQYASHLLKKLCEDIGTQQVFASVEHPILALSGGVLEHVAC